MFINNMFDINPREESTRDAHVHTAADYTCAAALDHSSQLGAQYLVLHQDAAIMHAPESVREEFIRALRDEGFERTIVHNGEPSDFSRDSLVVSWRDAQRRCAAQAKANAEAFAKGMLDHILAELEPTAKSGSSSESFMFSKYVDAGDLSTILAKLGFDCAWFYFGASGKRRFA